MIYIEQMYPGIFSNGLGTKQPVDFSLSSSVSLPGITTTNNLNSTTTTQHGINVQFNGVSAFAASRNSSPGGFTNWGIQGVTNAPAILTLGAPNITDYADFTYDGSNADIDVSKGNLNLRPLAAGGNVEVWNLVSNVKVSVGSANFTQSISLSHDGTNALIDVSNGNLKITTSGIGFYNVAPITRQLLATGAGHTVDDVITTLQNLGLVKQS